MHFSSAPVLFLVLGARVAGFQQTDVTFYLFTENSLNYTQIFKENATIKSKHLVFLIHGWQESRLERWYEQLKNLFLAKGETDVIQVDWSEPASQFYPAAAYDCPRIGNIIADFVMTLLERSTPTVHLVGHSLGGHVAGFAGKCTQQRGFKIPRITALDPAGPLFQESFVSASSRLTRTDAQIVVAIHTDTYKFGYYGTCGTVDIYPNGYTVTQPECPDYSEDWLGCSHRMSREFYIDALEYPGTFIAQKCWWYWMFLTGLCQGNRRIDLGGDINEEDSGVYYLVTRKEKPYGMGK